MKAERLERSYGKYLFPVRDKLREGDMPVDMPVASVSFLPSANLTPSLAPSLTPSVRLHA